MGIPLAVRLAGPADIDQIDAIEASAFEGDRFARRNLRRMLASPSAATLLAMRSGEPVGYALVLFRKNARVARLYSIAVLASARGSGAGMALLEAAADHAVERGASLMRLEVRASNQEAVRLYARAAFHESGRREGYYPDGETAIVMDRALNAPTKEGHSS